MNIHEYNPEDPNHRAALARKILDTLTKAGFRQTHEARALEVVMERPVKAQSGEIPNTIIRVYTTVDVRHPRIRNCPGCRDARFACPVHALSVRGCGKDAIRVCALYLENQQALSEKAPRARGLTKHRRVHRTGQLDAIVERMMERARDAWRAVCKRPRCRHCGAPTFTAKSGKDVCAAICWEKKR